MEIPDKLLNFINESRQPLPPVTDLDEPLRLDSLAMMRLVSFMESEIGYTVESTSLKMEMPDNGRVIEVQHARIGGSKL